MILTRSNTHFFLRLVTLKSKKIAIQGTVSCHHMNRKSSLGIRSINIYFLQRSPMKSLALRYQAQRLTNQQRNSSPTGIRTRRSTCCSYTSSQDQQKLTDHRQLRGLSQMGQEVLVLSQGHRLQQFYHPRHMLRHPRHLTHLWGCPLGSRRRQLGVFNLHRLHLRLQMVLRDQSHLHLFLAVQWLTSLMEQPHHVLQCKAFLGHSNR